MTFTKNEWFYDPPPPPPPPPILKFVNFILKIEYLSVIELLVFLRRRNAKEKKCKQSQKIGNHKDFKKMDVLNNVNGNVNKTMVWIMLIKSWFEYLTTWIKDIGQEIVKFTHEV